MSVFTDLSTAIVVAAVIVTGCMKKPDSAQSPLPHHKKRVVHLEKLPFIPSGDSTVAPDQMRAWTLCNTSLDSLSLVYIDSFKTEDPAVRIRCQQNFAVTQDDICIRNGLKSGYEEYVWILKCSALPKNRGLLDSLNSGAVQ